MFRGKWSSLIPNKIDINGFWGQFGNCVNGWFFYVINQIYGICECSLRFFYLFLGNSSNTVLYQFINESINVGVWDLDKKFGKSTIKYNI